MYKNLNNQSQGTDNCAGQEITFSQINNQYVVDLENKTDPDRLALGFAIPGQISFIWE